MPPETSPIWDSLEITKLAVSALTPILLFVFGLKVAHSGRRVEQATWSNRKLIERRLELHGLMSPLLNDIYCFMCQIGHFRSIDPPQLIQAKRDLDRIFFANEQLFSSSFGANYRTFMRACFRTWSGSGEDSKIRVNRPDFKKQRGAGAPWDQSWDVLFEDSPPELAVQRNRAYAQVMEVFARQVGKSDSAKDD